MNALNTFRPIACTVGLTCAISASVAAPVALNITPGFSLSAYTGSAPLYAGLVDIDNTLFYLREHTGAGVQAWTVFFDPLRTQRVAATLDFGAPILNVFSTSAGLSSSALSYGVDINHDGFHNDYVLRNATGLERNDSLSWAAGSSRLSLNWVASDPGDHIRVLVQDVPEPTTVALVLLALGGLGASQILWRRTLKQAASTAAA